MTRAALFHEFFFSGRHNRHGKAMKAFWGNLSGEVGGVGRKRDEKRVAPNRERGFLRRDDAPYRWLGGIAQRLAYELRGELTLGAMPVTRIISPEG
jgi:hypothetical protein